MVTVEQMCEMLGGISTKTAYKPLKAGRIDYFRIGRTYKIPRTKKQVDCNRIADKGQQKES
ncbi:helix-turn-helix domain-containing protein [Paenibacillus thiaminolyticus]|uniref:helix-turn-helix domain-containing protein n=1 Tax=Paenibacillus thiaminolyticus TaxID=49283 RepID=UPI0035A6054C